MDWRDDIPTPDEAATSLGEWCSFAHAKQVTGLCSNRLRAMADRGDLVVRRVGPRGDRIFNTRALYSWLRDEPGATVAERSAAMDAERRRGNERRRALAKRLEAERGCVGVSHG